MTIMKAAATTANANLIRLKGGREVFIRTGTQKEFAAIA
jgi:hypothetical protein